MAKERKLDVEALVQIAQQFGKEYRETGAIGIDTRSGKPIVQVLHDALAEVASPDVWTWERRNSPDGCVPWRASVTIDGVKFLALFNDEEQQAVIDGE